MIRVCVCVFVRSCVPSSVIGTPADNVVVQRRSKSKSYRLSYRSCLSAASRLGFTPTMTSRRMNSSRRAPKSHNITVCICIDMSALKSAHIRSGANLPFLSPSSSLSITSTPPLCLCVCVTVLLKKRVDPEQLALLVKTEWQLSYVTPLYQFRHSKLKNYSRQLAAFIAAQKLQGMAVEVDGPQDHYKVSFSIVPGMVEAGDDAETVLVQVSFFYIFSCHKKVSYKSIINNSPVWYPLLHINTNNRVEFFTLTRKIHTKTSCTLYMDMTLLLNMYLH